MTSRSPQPRAASTLGWSGLVPLVASVRGEAVLVDDLIEPEALAAVVSAGLATDDVLILPHPEVAEYVRRRGADPARWVAGMRRLWARTKPG